MAAGNRSPLGFGTILAFHLCVLGVGVLLQNLYMNHGAVAFGVTLGAVLTLGAVGVGVFHQFLWDMFRGFKCAAVLIALLVTSCILGTLFIQDLDLRRAGIFNKGVAEIPPGTPEDQRWRYEYPDFDLNTQSGRFAFAQSFGMLSVKPNEERKKQIADKVHLSPIEKQKVRLRSEAFGERAGNAYREAILHSKERNVNEVTAQEYARRNFTSKAYARKRWPGAEGLGWFEHFGLYDLWTLARQLHLFDIFESIWFYMLLGLIAVNVTVGTIVRAPWSMRDIGIAITHSGILIILTGALLDVLVAKEGYVYFKYGVPAEQKKSEIYDQKTKTTTALPFTVQLDRFATEYYHEMLVEAYDWSRRADGSLWPDQEGPRRGAPFSVAQTFPIRIGVPRLYEDGTVKVVVHDYKPRVFVQTVVEDDGTGRIDPAVKLGLYNNPQGEGTNFFVHGNTEPWVFAADRRRNALERFDARFEYVWARDEDQYREIIQQPPVPNNGWLVLRTKEEVKRVPVRLGRSVPVTIGDRTINIEFRNIGSGLQNNPGNVNVGRTRKSDDSWLYLKVDGQEFPVPRDDTEFTHDFRILQGVELRFDWPNPTDAGVHFLYRIVEGDGLPRVLVQLTDEDEADVKALPEGTPVRLFGLEGGYLGVEQQVNSARERRDIHEVTDEEFLREGGGRRDEMLAAWADIEITGPFGEVRREMTPYDPPIYYGRNQDGNPLFAFGLFKTQQARDWFSVLSVVGNNGERIKTHTVQVNSPLRYQGWRFFQATAATDTDGLGVSGISVTNNPGVNFMYVGYLVLTLGVCWIFFLKPVLTRRRRRKALAEKEAAGADSATKEATA